MNDELIQIIKNRRSIRFFEQRKVEHDKLTEIAECMRLAPSGANLQPMRCMIIEKEELVKKIFAQTKWAGYLPDVEPTEDEAPAAFIVLLADTQTGVKNYERESGITGTNGVIAAQALGLSTCWIGAYDKNAVREILAIPPRYELCYLIGVGYAAHGSTVYDSETEVRYSMDENGDFRVPKIPKKSFIIEPEVE